MSLAARLLFRVAAGVHNLYRTTVTHPSATTTSPSTDEAESFPSFSLRGTYQEGAALPYGSPLSSSSSRFLNTDPVPIEETDDVLSIETQETMDHFIDSQVAHAVASVAAVLAIVISIHLMYRHLQYYSRPLLQRQIIRIVMIVPVYALCSAISLGFDHYAPYINALRDVYEALCIHCFLALMLDFPGGEDAVIEGIKDKGKMKHPKPFCCCPKMRLGVDFIVNMKRTTLQFVILKPIMAFITIIAMAGDFYDTPELQSFLLFVYNISYTTALYGLLLYYMATKTLMKGFSPVGKFGAVKIIVFATYYQSLAVVAIPGMDSLGSSEKWNDFIICFEMALFAIMHEYCFNHSEFMPGGVGVRDLKAMGFGEEPVNIKSDTSFKAAMSRIGDVANLSDVWDDMKRNFSLSASQYILQGVEGGILNDGTVELETQRAEEKRPNAIAMLLKGKKPKIREETNDDDKKDGEEGTTAKPVHDDNDDDDNGGGIGGGSAFAIGDADDFQSQLAAIQLASSADKEAERAERAKKDEEARKKREEEERKQKDEEARNGAVSAREAAASTAALMAASSAAAAELLAKLKAEQNANTKGKRSKGTNQSSPDQKSSTISTEPKDDSIRFVGDDEDERDKNALDTLKEANPAFAAALTTSALGNNVAGKVTGKAVAVLGGAAVAVATKVTAKVTDAAVIAGLGPRPKEGVANRVAVSNSDAMVFDSSANVDTAEIERSVRESAALAAAKKKQQETEKKDSSISTTVNTKSTEESTGPKLKIDASKVKTTVPTPSKPSTTVTANASGSWDFPEESTTATATPSKTPASNPSTTVSAVTEADWAAEVDASFGAVEKNNVSSDSSSSTWNPDAEFGFGNNEGTAVSTTTTTETKDTDTGDAFTTLIEDVSVSNTGTENRLRAPSGDDNGSNRARSPSGDAVVTSSDTANGTDDTTFAFKEDTKEPERAIEDDGRASPVHETMAEAVGQDEEISTNVNGSTDFDHADTNAFETFNDNDTNEETPTAGTQANTSTNTATADDWGVSFDASTAFTTSTSSVSNPKGEVVDPFGDAVDMDSWK